MKLVAGCGIRTLQGDVVAVDRDLTSLRRYGADRRVCADIRYLPFREGTFETIDFWNVLEHVKEKEPLVMELARMSAPGAKMMFSAGLRGCDRLLGKISRTYRRQVTNGYHVHSTTADHYLRMLSKHFELVRVRYPSSVYVFLVEGLIDFYGVTISEAGEYQGRNGEKVLGIAKRWTPYLQPFFGWMARFFREKLSQTIEVEAERA